MGLVTKSAPKGLTRFVLHMPIWLYRFHLGWLLGKRFLMLTHVGRKSGLPHQTVVEIVDYNESLDTYMIASGWGEKSDWLRNILKTPDVQVQVGTRHFEATAHRLSATEAEDALFSYANRHPRAFEMLSKLMMGHPLRPIRPDCRLLAQSVPLVALQPKK